MSDQQDGAVPRSLADEIEAGLAAVWARYVGARPKDAEIELDGCVVRLRLPEGTEQFKRAMKGEEPPEDANGRPRTLAGYERESARAVSRVTRRRVDAIISKHDAKTGVATETFILEPLLKRY